jgi:hypothetical protein
MTSKDRVIHATDRMADALKALCRINYDNERQTAANMVAAAAILRGAADALEAKS